MSRGERAVRAVAILAAAAFLVAVIAVSEASKASRCLITVTDDGVVHHVIRGEERTYHYLPHRCPKCKGDYYE